MVSLPASAGRQVLLTIVTAIQTNSDYLSELDGATGDGDHGINMNKGFTSFKAKIGDAPIGLSEGLNTLGNTLLTEIGGAMGPLYGTLFLAMGSSCAGLSHIDAQQFGNMLKSALTEVQELGGASAGDKTLLDALLPAVNAYQHALSEGKSFVQALQAMAAAAEAGKESTREMVAKLGRASRLGERSRGHLDAGAASCAVILTALMQGVSAQLTEVSQN